MQIDQVFLKAANEAGHRVLELAPIAPGVGNTRSGVLCAANEQAFVASFMSQPITTYIQGMPDQDDVQAALDFVAPPVPTGRRFEFRKFGNTQQFLSETDDIRGAGANFKVVEFSGDLQSARTINKGLAFIGDLDVVGEIPNWEQLYSNWLRVRVLRNELRRAYTALLALHAGTTAKWISADATDPDTDLLALAESLGDSTGLNANAIAIGSTAWQYRVQNLRSTDKAGGFASSMWTPQQLAEWLSLTEGIRKSTERYGTGTGAKTRMLGAYAVAFHRTNSAVMEDPSSLKRFITAAGGQFQVYRRELSAKLIEISVAHYSNIVSTGSAVRLNVQ